MVLKEKNENLKKIGIKGVILVICALLFAALTLDVFGTYRLEAFDQWIYKTVRHLESPFFTAFFKLMTNMVHPLVMLCVSFFMIHVLKQRRYLVAIFFNLILAALLNVAIKNVFMRARPLEELRLVTESGYSFPSGHSMVAAAFYGILIFMIRQTDLPKRRKRVSEFVCFMMIILVGISRIYLGVHYGTDVLGGYLVSTMYLLVYTTVIKTYLESEQKVFDNPLAQHKLLMSFKYAFDGIIEGIRNERNMMIHYGALIMVVVFGLTLKLSVIEWSICLILCALVIAMELMNTAIEAVVDLVTEEKKPLAKLAKDTAAGAVLVCAIMAAIIGCMIFLPKVFALFSF